MGKKYTWHPLYKSLLFINRLMLYFRLRYVDIHIRPKDDIVIDIILEHVYPGSVSAILRINFN